MKMLCRVLLRQALIAQPINPRSWLVALQTSQYTALSASGGDITGTSVNGKSVSLSIPANFSKKDLLDATEICIQFLDRGGDPTIGPVSTTMAVFRAGGALGPL
jgi:hypothetical protein